ncbi:MAG: hypothetical protein ACF8TS_03810, partial [Maioricimonas sp. JB049]
RHLRCNPTLAQFIVDEAFEPVRVEGPFSKQELDRQEVLRREDLVSRGWRRLQEVRRLRIPISDYPLSRMEQGPAAPDTVEEVRRERCDDQ